MNRFRTKKKAKETPEGLVRASSDSDGSSMPTVKSSKTFFGSKKNHEPEPKLEINIANALPSSDDFRTSLLMSGLSARFSMLREQDDPKSKIGKASDDSVLFPKRQSRLNDLGFQPRDLADIAEVSSINGSIRPPFASSRTDSYHGGGGTGTDDESLHTGSIMNRAKPGESNNLFGGRQKIYMGNRALYDNDVSQSAFQKLRQQDREQERQKREERRKETEAQLSRPNSPPFSGYNRNRETSSTTSSGGPSVTRTSTAATSVTSQRTPSLSGAHGAVQTPNNSNVPQNLPGLERSATKGRRLYETGLDNHLHEQQNSAMNRIDTITRQRTLRGQSPPQGMSPTYAINPGGGWEKKQIAGQASMPNLRAASPPPIGPVIGTFDFSLKQTTTTQAKPFGMASPPLSPPMSENDELSVLAVQPNDRGKATALGTFQKPVQAYDENKYTQRQLQMQQGRETPPMWKHSPPRAFAPRQQQQPQPNMGRPRAESNSTFASGSSRSNSFAQRNFLPQERIPETIKPQVSVPEDQAISSGTFLSSPNASPITSPSDDAPEPSRPRGNPKPLDLSSMYRPDQYVKLERPPESQHPAHRSHAFPDDWNVDSSNSSTTTFNLPAKSNTSVPPADSPTLGPTTGLSGMVRQHLRSDSNTSSVYEEVPSGDFASRFPPEALSLDTPNQNVYSTKSNPWDTDDWDQGYYGEGNLEQDDAANTLNGGSGVLPPPLSVRSPVSTSVPQDTSRAPWEKEMGSRHKRDGSSETQKERQDFQEELATRRRRVKENLKSLVENESRSASPVPGTEFPKDTSTLRNNALGILKTKTSRGSLVIKPKDGQSKTMKMLGLGSATISSSPSPRKDRFEESWKQEESPVRAMAKPPTPPQMKAIRQARREAQRDRERQVAMRYQQPRSATEAPAGEWPSYSRKNQSLREEQRNEQPTHDFRAGNQAPSRERKPPPVTHVQRNNRISQESKDSSGSARSGSRPPSHMSRDRSSSDASGGRSQSRNGRLRNGSIKPEGMPGSSQGYYEDLQPPPTRQLPRSPATPNICYQQSPISSPMMGQNTRARSNSKSPAYFDTQKFPTLQSSSHVSEIGIAPRPSPPSPFVVNPTPALTNTSTDSSASSTTSQPAQRKRSINKTEISEPRFISSTSRLTTVNLPPGASLHNGIDTGAPPIPAVNPRRRQTRTMFGGLMGRKDEFGEMHSLPAATQSTEEMSTFSADDSDSKPKTRAKLRKSSSEGGNLNARARQIANATPSPAMPGTFPPDARSPPRAVEGGMF